MVDNSNSVLIAHIRKARKAKKKTQISFAKEIGWSYEKYMNFEKGVRVTMCDQDLKTMCDRLDLMIVVGAKV
jgi:transcriptional regulator with XRE-family HTH domain